jgi:COP9 signalosome complex subunit 7
MKGLLIAANEASFPPLSPAQIDKLRRLTLVSLASESHVPPPQCTFLCRAILPTHLQDLDYAELMKTLDINNTRDLEDLCINTIYASLLQGKLSPQTQQFRITSCTSRDLNPATLDYGAMIDTLSAWSSQCDLVLTEITARIRDVKSESLARKTGEEEYDKAVEGVRKVVAADSAAAARKGNVGGRGKGRGRGVALEDFDEGFMEDVEEHPVPSTSSSSGGRGNKGRGGDSPTRRKRKLVVLTPS